MTEKFHTVRSYDGDLRALDTRIQQMGGLAIAQARDAVDVIVTRNTANVARVQERENEINRMEHEVNELVVRTLALRQPMADDLRAVVMALKIASMLERVGDHAVGAVRRGLSLDPRTTVPVRGPVSRMGELVVALLDDALRAFADKDVDLACQVRARDSEVDALHSSLFRELLTYMLEDPRSISTCSQLMFVSKSLERIGDQATNIAEAAYYRATGKTLHDDRRKEDDTATAVVDPDDL